MKNQIGDMVVGLYNLPTPKIKTKVEVSRLFISDIELLMDFLDKEFLCEKGWKKEIQYAAYQAPIKVFIAKDKHEILGFACYDCSAKSFFGPFGVKESCRGKGVGTKLFFATLEDMKANGYAYAIIGWVGPSACKFYQKVANAQYIKNSTPDMSVYSNKTNLKF